MHARLHARAGRPAPGQTEGLPHGKLSEKVERISVSGGFEGLLTELLKA